MTEQRGEQEAWTQYLRDVSRASGHDLRNALNALVVNLEVVRARTSSLDDSVRFFVTQSVEQAEHSVKQAEATIALLNLVVGAIGADGRFDRSVASSVSGAAVILKTQGSEAGPEHG